MESIPPKIHSCERHDALRSPSTRTGRFQAINARFYDAHFISRSGRPAFFHIPPMEQVNRLVTGDRAIWSLALGSRCTSNQNRCRHKRRLSSDSGVVLPKRSSTVISPPFVPADSSCHSSRLPGAMPCVEHNQSSLRCSAVLRSH